MRIAASSGERTLVDLVQQRAQVAGEIVEGSARGHDVDEPEERRAQLGVAGREVQARVVERLQRVAGVGGKRLGELEADAPNLTSW
jgi:hypothetical protein